MVKKGSDCFSTCPNGWQDSGLFCRIPEYSRGGSSYPWKITDGFNNNASIARC